MLLNYTHGRHSKMKNIINYTVTCHVIKNLLSQRVASAPYHGIC